VKTVVSVVYEFRRRNLLDKRELAYFTAGNLEGHHNSVTFLQTLDGGTHLVHYSHELVAEDVAFLHLNDGAYNPSVLKISQ